MTDRPIIFQAAMVRAILEGDKTQTRRVIKPQPVMLDGANPSFTGWQAEQVASGVWELIGGMGYGSEPFGVPYAVGDRQWVRESWSGEHVFHDTPPAERTPLDTGHGTVSFPETVHCWADGDPEWGDWERPRPSIHMPRWASRLTLIVTDVRVQRVQDISEADALAEGVKPVPVPGRLTPLCVPAFRSLWDSINAAKGCGWDDNPWVVAVSFDVHKANIDQIAGDA